MQIKVNTYVDQTWANDDTCESSFLVERIIGFFKSKREIHIGNGCYQKVDCCNIRFDNNRSLLVKETFEEVSKLMEEVYKKQGKTT